VKKACVDDDAYPDIKEPLIDNTSGVPLRLVTVERESEYNMTLTAFCGNLFCMEE